MLRAWRKQCPELRALWDKSKPVTAWAGLTFGKAIRAHLGRVVKIWLFRKGLTGDVPAALGRLTALTALNLDGNQLMSVPAELGRLTALTELSLYGNQLTRVPEKLGALTTLTRLMLGGNQLTSVPAEWMRGGALAGGAGRESRCFIDKYEPSAAVVGGVLVPFFAGEMRLDGCDEGVLYEHSP